jgi:hypothetical protein
VALDEAIKPSQQSASDARIQNLLLLDLAGAFEDRLQTGEELVGRPNGIGQNLRGGEIVFLRVAFLGWMP